MVGSFRVCWVRNYIEAVTARVIELLVAIYNRTLGTSAFGS